MPESLWDFEHPYHGPDGGDGQDYDSWADFIDEFRDSDFDLNLVFRWDWLRPDPDSDRERDELLIFFVQQRKDRLYHARINVDESDEPAVREWLGTRLTHLMLLWQPLGPRQLVEGASDAG